MAASATEFWAGAIGERCGEHTAFMVKCAMSAMKESYAEGAGQEAMRERAAAFYEKHSPRLKAKGEDGYRMVERVAELLPSEQATADFIRALPIEEPSAS
ncbi:hypothetical protein GR238_36790 [Rhizobium leguminosarum]|uniref:hypothetical protein n=1 Tax=Rhizobium ruizarguesonis TaxID=2081791 RepID=UPI0013BA1953|nr:hypothetical protein [Rhizobium ruizarguesonis]NEJ10879.1 hypothetical protein [Rhizobium ruizarguesonis]